jgi:hypothetical protein
MSGKGLKETDEVTTLWVPWQAAVAKAGGNPQALMLGAAGKIAGKVLNLFALVICAHGGADKLKGGACLAPSTSHEHAGPSVGQKWAAAQWGGLVGSKTFTDDKGAVVGIPAGVSVSDTKLVPTFLADVSKIDQTAFLLLLGLSSKGVPPEFAAWSQLHGRNKTIDAETSALLLFGGGDFKCPLLIDPRCVIKLVMGDTRVFPLQDKELLAELGKYFASVSTHVFQLLFALSKRASPTAQPVFVKRSVKEMLFHFDDPLLKLLKPGATNSAFFPTDFKDINEAFLYSAGPETIRTGADDILMTRAYLGFDGVHVLPRRTGGRALSTTGVWCNVAPEVSGHRLTNFPPGKATNSYFSFEPTITEESVLEVFVTELLRKTTFTFNKNVAVKGDIDAFEFIIDPKMLEPDHDYDIYHRGVINMTCPRGGVPVMLTQPRFLDADGESCAFSVSSSFSYCLSTESAASVNSSSHFFCPLFLFHRHISAAVVDGRGCTEG